MFIHIWCFIFKECFRKTLQIGDRKQLLSTFFFFFYGSGEMDRDGIPVLKYSLLCTLMINLSFPNKMSSNETKEVQKERNKNNFVTTNAFRWWWITRLPVPPRNNYICDVSTSLSFHHSLTTYLPEWFWFTLHQTDKVYLQVEIYILRNCHECHELGAAQRSAPALIWTVDLSTVERSLSLWVRIPLSVCLSVFLSLSLRLFMFF